MAKIAEALGITSDYLVDAAEGVSTPAVRDDAFYRQCRRLPDDTKEKIRQMVEICGKGE